MSALRRAFSASAAGLAFAPVALAGVSTPLIVDVGEGPRAVAAADMDGDCRDEVVVGGARGLEVLTRLSDGTFVRAWADSSVPPIDDLALADLDGDGALDLIAAHRQRDRISAWRAEPGDPTKLVFTRTAHVSVGRGPNSVSVADVDGDLRLDVVTAYQNGGSVGVLLGDGRGGFVSGGEIGGFTLPWDVVATELDGEAGIDLLVADYWGDAIVRLDGDGAGGFTEGARLVGAGGPLELAVGDAGVVAILRDAARLVLLDGDLVIRHGQATGPDPGDLSLSDVDDDGRADAIVCDAMVGDIRVYAGNETGFDAPVGAPLIAPARAAAAAQLDADARRDLLAALGPIGGAQPGKLWVASRDEKGAFPRRADRLLDSRPVIVVVGDLTGDLIPDLLVAGDRLPEIHLHPGTTGGGFAEGRLLALSHAPSAAAIGDIDGDGAMDVVVTYRDADSLGVYVRTPGGELRRSSAAGTAPRPSAITLADLDGDGRLDALVSSMFFDAVVAFRSTGQGHLARRQVLDGGDGPLEPLIGDLDGDGAPDLVHGVLFEDVVRVRRGRGDGTFLSARTYPVGRLIAYAALVDANGDGTTDILTAGVVTRSVSVLPGSGDGLFGAAIETRVEDSFDRALVCEVDDDEIPDVLLVRGTQDRLVAVLGSGDGTFPRARRLDGGLAPEHLRMLVGENGVSGLVVVRAPRFDVGIATVFPTRDIVPVDGSAALELFEIAGGVRVVVTPVLPEAVVSWRVEREAAGIFVALHEAGTGGASSLEWVDAEAVHPGAYRYRVTLERDGGDFCPGGIASVTIAPRFAFGGVGPNPFTGATDARMQIPAPGLHVAARIFDVTGRVLVTLHDRFSPGGELQLEWNGRTSSGRPAPAGVYWLGVRAGARERAARLVLIR